MFKILEPTDKSAVTLQHSENVFHEALARGDVQRGLDAPHASSEERGVGLQGLDGDSEGVEDLRRVEEVAPHDGAGVVLGPDEEVAAG